jgi:hypothetical protein
MIPAETPFRPAPEAGSLLGLAALAAVLGACSAEGVTFEDPGGDEGDLPRPTLVVEVGVDSADAELAEALGWTEGVPGAEVQILRSGTLEWIEGSTDDSGRVVFTDLEPGRHHVVGERVLSSEEASAIGAEIRAFGDGRTVEDLGRDTARLRLDLLADRPGSLVLAEISDANGTGGDNVAPSLARVSWYLEIYNQGEETRYLDGVILGFNFGWGCEDCFMTCEATEPLRTNSERLGAAWMLQFPGSGGEYPIGPGKVRVMAVSALDHRDIHPNMLDLRDADFEIPPSGVADNPEVPNMRDVGPERFTPSMLSTVVSPKFLAEPLDVEALPVIYRDRRARAYLGVPREKVLDVTMTEYKRVEGDLEHPECRPAIHRAFDRFPSFVVSGEDPGKVKSTQRRVLRTGPGGFPILMNTRTSAVDLREVRRTPGSLP